MCVLRRMRYWGRKEKHLNYFLFLVKYIVILSGEAEYHFKGFCIKKKMGAYAYTHTHRQTSALLQMLRVFCFSEGSAASRWREDKSQPLGSSEDTFRGIRKPTAFIFVPIWQYSQMLFGMTLIYKEWDWRSSTHSQSFSMLLIKFYFPPWKRQDAQAVSKIHDSVRHTVLSKAIWMRC